MNDAEFDALLEAHRAAVERFVRFRIPAREDAEDVLQDVFITAYRHLGSLQNPQAFKAWLISIARSRCADHFRAAARRQEVPLEIAARGMLSRGGFGPARSSAVSDTLERLSERDRQILYLYYYRQWPQAQIAARLGIPIGTVKSRLHTAKRNFRAIYPRRGEETKGETIMIRLPETLPEYRIERMDEPPFDVVLEELMGWPIVPRLGERCLWGLYDQLSGRRTEYTDMEVVGRAEVHGIEGVEIVAMQNDAEDYYRTGRVETLERRFVAQLTDTHCRYLAESHVEDGVRRVFTFLDGDSFTDNWGYGENNCGSQTHLSAKGLLRREGNAVVCRTGRGSKSNVGRYAVSIGGKRNESMCIMDAECYDRVEREMRDIVGRYAVTIGGKRYDTVCVMDVECFSDAVACEQYVDQSGHTVLWRRFNRDDWAIDRFGGQRWSERLPDNERITVDGETYVHWYDCITDYIL